LPKRWGLVEVSRSNVVVSTLKPGPEGSVILRVYEATGRSTNDVRIKLNAGVASAHEADLLEDSGPELSAAGDTLHFDLRPYEIRTSKLKLRPWGAGK
jgi:alpha-mannosidase